MDFMLAVIVFIVIWAVFASYAQSTGKAGHGPYSDKDEDNYPGDISDEDLANWGPPE